MGALTPVHKGRRVSVFYAQTSGGEQSAYKERKEKLMAEQRKLRRLVKLHAVLVKLGNVTVKKGDAAAQAKKLANAATIAKDFDDVIENIPTQ